MPTVTSSTKRSPLREDWRRLAGTWSVLVHASSLEAERVANGAPYVLAPADSVSASSLLGQVVGECASRWGATPEGAAGPICPHIHGSLSKGGVWVGSVPPVTEVPALESDVLPLLDLFDGLEAISGTRLTSVVVVVPSADPGSGSAIVEATHRSIKSAALERGLLPGEFGRTLVGPGSRFTDIATRKSEVCEYLALRRLLRADRKYCESDPQWLDRFQANFAEAS